MEACGLEEKLGYRFREPRLLETALTHSSYGLMEDGRRVDNERLEFIGDAFLDAICAEMLYERLPEASEGTLTKLRALVVCEASLARLARELELGEQLRLGPGDEKTGGRERDSLLADAMEAVLGAIYGDGGYEAARTVMRGLLGERVEEAVSGRLFRDYKSLLQEHLQKQGKQIHYLVEREEGPEHAKTFYVRAEADGRVLGHGRGSSKKEAEQNAASQILQEGKDVF